MERRKRLEPGEPPKRKTGLRRTSAMQQQGGRESLSAREATSKSAPTRRQEMVQRPRRRSTKALRADLAVRSGGVCEIQQEGCQGRAVEPCHRIGTGMGGVHGAAVELSDRLSNAVHGCRSCGQWQHDHEYMAKAYGQILKHGKDPLREPVLLRYGVVLLDDEGGWAATPELLVRERIREAAATRRRGAA